VDDARIHLVRAIIISAPIEEKPRGDGHSWPTTPAHRPNGALRFRCKGCKKDFTVTSGTLFASHKMPLRGYLAAIAVFCNEVMVCREGARHDGAWWGGHERGRQLRRPLSF
jgi:hypothetical protein